MGDGGPHQVAVALFAGPADGEPFSGGPCRLLWFAGLECVFCEAVGCVVDGDDGVGDDAFGVGPAVAVFDSAEGESFDEFEGGLQVFCHVAFGCLVGGSDVVGEPVRVAADLGADLVEVVGDGRKVWLAIGVGAEGASGPPHEVVEPVAVGRLLGVEGFHEGVGFDTVAVVSQVGD